MASELFIMREQTSVTTDEDWSHISYPPKTPKQKNNPKKTTHQQHKNKPKPNNNKQQNKQTKKTPKPAK